MHADFVVAVLQRLERQGIVEILGVRRVDGEGKGPAEILAALQVRLGDLLGDLVGGAVHLRREPVGEVELRQDGMHLGIVVAGHAEHVDQVAVRAVVAAVPAVHDRRDLHPGLGAHPGPLLGIHLDVVGHRLALHQDPGLGPDGVVIAHEGAVGAFDDLHHLAFAAVGIVLLPGHGHAHGIAVQGVPGLGGLDEDIVVLAVDDHEDEPFTGHLYLPDILREHFLLACAGPFLTSGCLPAFSTSFLHNHHKDT